MELKQYFLIARKWLWLLVLCTILGAGAAFGFSYYQTPLYQSAAKAMISQPSWDQLNELGFLYPSQMIQTYSELLTTTPLLSAAGESVGVHISPHMVTVTQVAETNIISVSVEYDNPNKAAELANQLIEVLIKQNEALDASRFSESEQSLQAQIAIVQNQIASLENEIYTASEETVLSQLANVEGQIALLQGEIVDLQLEITNLQSPDDSQAVPFYAPTPTLDVATQTKIQEYQLDLEQRQGMLDRYQEIYFTLYSYNSGEGNNPYSNASGNSQYQNTLALYQQIYANLLSDFEDVRLSRLEKTVNIINVEPAVPNMNPVRPQPLINTLLGAVVGLMLAGGFVFLVEYLDDTVKSPEEIQRFTSSPIIGHLPAFKASSLNGHSKTNVFVMEYPRSPVAESFRSLRTNIEFAEISLPTKVIMITSPEPQEGKSTTAANLAAIIAQGGNKVYLVDADLRRPTIHKAYNFTNRLGISEYFRGEAELHQIFNYVDDEKRLVAITSGKLPPNPSELLASDKMGHFLNQLRNEQAYVILDTPPLMVTDPVVLTSKVDGTLLVVEPGSTRLSSLRSSLDQLERSNARIIGIALNNISPKSSYYYGSYYSSTYYHSEDDD